MNYVLMDMMLAMMSFSMLGGWHMYIRPMLMAFDHAVIATVYA